MSIVDPILNWILVFNPFIAILIISIFLGVITTLVYKYASNQKKIKELKDKTKKLQKKIKKISKTEPEKVMEINAQMMKLNGPLMKETMKPTLWTIIPSLLILTWMASNLAFASISPGQSFTITAEFNDGVTGEIIVDSVPEGLEFLSGNTKEIVDNKAIWELKSEQENTYSLLFKFRELEVNKELIVSNSWEYSTPEEIVNQEGIKKITINNEKTKPFKGIPIIGNLNWLWSYIILTMVFTTVLRKLLKVY